MRSRVLKITGRIAKWTGIAVISIILLLVILVFTIRTPWAQQQLTGRITKYVSEKTGTTVEIKKFFITFRGDVQLEGVYLEDLDKDTMLYIGSLEAGVAFFPLISGDINVSRINWQGLVADIHRDKDSTFNFDFLIDAFASPFAPKDTTAKEDKALPHIGLGPVNFSGFRVSYVDEVIGINAKLDLGSLNLKTKSIDLNTLEFKVNELTLLDVNASAMRWLSGPAAPDKDTNAGTLPFISCNNISLKNINLSYTDSVESIQTSLDLDTLGVTNAEFDGIKKVIKAGDITLLNVSAKVELPEVMLADNDTVRSAKPFTWPQWKVNLDKLEIAGTDLEMKRANVVATPAQFNANDLRVEALQLELENVVLDSDKAELKIKNLAFLEQSGFELNSLALDVKLDTKKAQVKKLELTTPNNFIDAEITVSYAALDSLISNPLTAHVDLDIKQADLSVLDAYFFAPQLKTDMLIQAVASYPISLSGAVSGTMKDLDIADLKISALHSFDLALRGNIKGLPDTNAIRVNIPALSVSLTKKDLLLFIDSLSNPAMLPDSISLQAKLDGSVRNLLADLFVQTNRGNVKLDARLENIFSVPSAAGKLMLENIDAGTMVAIPELQPVSLTMDFKGKGKTIEQLTLDAKLDFTKLNFRNYDYSNLKLSISAADKKTEIILQHTDKNLDIELLANALLDTLNPQADLQIHLRGADLHALGVSPENVKVGAEIQANWKGLPSDFDASLAVTKGTIIKENEAHYLRPITMTLNNSVDSTLLIVNSEILNGRLEANRSIDTIIGSLTSYIQRLYSTDSLRAGLMNISLDVSAHFTVNNSRLLNGVLFSKLTRMDSIRLDLEFHPLANKLDLNLTAPKIVYADFMVDSLGVYATADGDNMVGELYFKQVKGGPVNIHRTKVDAVFKDKVAAVQLAISDSAGKPVAAIAAGIDLTAQNTVLKITPEGLLLNGEPWIIPADNSGTLTKAGVLFRSMELSHGGQSLTLENAPAGNEEGVKANFRNFELSSFSTILSTADSLLSGSLNGTIELQQLKTTPGIEAAISLDRLTVMGNPIGTLTLNANNKVRDQYAIDLGIQGPSIDLKAKGTLVSSTSSLEMIVDMNRLDVKLAEGFTNGKLKESSGSIEAHCTLNGPLSKLQYKGYVGFNSASFIAKDLNSRFTLPDDRAEISNDGIIFKNFDVADANGKKITVNGTIDTRNVLDPALDLSIVTTNFQPLNSTRDNNELFYGKAFIDTDVKISGKLSLPVVTVKARLRKGTDITFIVPESEAAIEERKGLVAFRNMKDTLTSTILITEEQEEVSRITGIDLTGYFEIDRETSFTIVIDERSGDQIQIEGEAKLNLNITPNGIMTLSGNYEIAEGSYKMNFYGLAKRKFELVPGSKISWSGDPLSGALDLTAVYNVKTSASDLMTDQLAQSDESTQSQYRQSLPFKVMLNIDGELLKPEISFALDMPESSRMALGGNVYKRIKQLNESQAELDQQVFSLIVLNRFLPQSFEGDGSGSEKMARSSVSKLLSGQLNAYSAKYLKGFEVNLDVQSYTGVQTGNGAKTDLDVNVRKSLFNERVVVQVGSQVALEGSDKSYQANDIIGDLSLEYLLTKEGQYRLKAFRKNQFQDLVEGQVVVTGLSVLFSKDFNAFKQLFEKIPKVEEKEETEEEKEVEEAK